MDLLFMPENTKGSSALEASKGSAMVAECDCATAGWESQTPGNSPPEQ